MARKTGDYQIPFNKSGNQLHYPESWGRDDHIEWKDNFEFEDDLEVVGVARGRSAAYFRLRSKTTKKEYTMFLADFIELLQGTVLKGKWVFQKRGMNYGVRKA